MELQKIAAYRVSKFVLLKSNFVHTFYFLSNNVAWNEQFEKIEERLLNAVNGSGVPLPSNSGLHPHPVVRCQQETVALVNDSGYGVRFQANSSVSNESYRSKNWKHTGDEGSEDLAKQFESF